MVFPTLFVLAGPNGAGKTTFIDRFLEAAGGAVPGRKHGAGR